MKISKLDVKTVKILLKNNVSIFNGVLYDFIIKRQVMYF